MRHITVKKLCRNFKKTTLKQVFHSSKRQSNICTTFGLFKLERKSTEFIPTALARLRDRALFLQTEQHKKLIPLYKILKVNEPQRSVKLYLTKTRSSTFRRTAERLLFNAIARRVQSWEGKSCVACIYGSLGTKVRTAWHRITRVTGSDACEMSTWNNWVGI